MVKSCCLKKILVINNDPLIKEKIKDLINENFNNQFEIVTKNHIRAAIDHIVRAGIPDLIITDFNDEGEDQPNAIKLTNFVRSELHNSIPFVYFGNKFNDENVINILLESLEVYVNKNYVLSPVFISRNDSYLQELIYTITNLEFLLNKSSIDFS